MSKDIKLQQMADYLWDTVLGYAIEVVKRNDGIGSSDDAAKVLENVLSEGPAYKRNQMGRTGEQTKPHSCTVNLTYFNENGKFKYDGTYRTTKQHMYQIFDEVRQMLRERRLPGLIENHSPFIVHVDAPDNEHNYPGLVFLTE